MENLDLIDWRMVGFASLWILGAAVVLSVLGFAYDSSQRGQRSFRTALAGPAYQLSLNLGLMLFCVGLLGTANTLWEQIAWGALSLAFAAYSMVAFRGLRGTA
ncbi:MAG: hypothetical protein WBR18_11745 [Anaerolineales bacterium]